MRNDKRRKRQQDNLKAGRELKPEKKDSKTPLDELQSSLNIKTQITSRGVMSKTEVMTSFSVD